jgi:hypothetical protein
MKIGASRPKAELGANYREPPKALGQITETFTLAARETTATLCASSGDRYIPFRRRGVPSAESILQCLVGFRD